MRSTARELVGLKRYSIIGDANIMLMKKATDVSDHLDAIASIRRGLAQAKEGLGRPVDEVFDDLEREAQAALAQT